MKKKLFIIAILTAGFGLTAFKLLPNKNTSTLTTTQTDADPQTVVQEFYTQLNTLAKNQDPSKIISLLTDDFTKLQFTDSLQNLTQYKEALTDLIEDVTLNPDKIRFYKIQKTTKKIVEANYAVIICMLIPKGKGEGLGAMDIWENHTFIMKKIGEAWKIQLLYINQIDVG